MHRLPNILTAFRLLVSFFVVLLIFLANPESSVKWASSELLTWLALGLFSAAGVTDYLDGYLARSRGWISELGRMFDPIADKVLVISVIAALLAVDRLPGVHFIPALVIIIREICIAGLREFLSTDAIDLHASFSGKVKTMIQILSLGFLIAAPASDTFLPSTIIGLTLLWLAAGVALISAYEYVRSVLMQLDLSGTESVQKKEEKE